MALRADRPGRVGKRRKRHPVWAKNLLFLRIRGPLMKPSVILPRLDIPEDRKNDRWLASGPFESSPSAAAVLAQLDKILASPAFETSERNHSFLRYVVEETLAG